MPLNQRPESMELRGVRVHNLQGIDLDIPLGRFVALCGVSGSGKSSLAFDTLFAEGQRRYVESFSSYQRQFLERLEKPDADRLDFIPPAVGVRQQREISSRRATVGTASEIHDSLRLLFARIGVIVCPDCGNEVRGESATRVASALQSLPQGTRFQILFLSPIPPPSEIDDWRQRWIQAGFTRILFRGARYDLATFQLPGAPTSAESSPAAEILKDQAAIIVDRLTAGGDASRLTDSLETAFEQGHGSACILIAAPLPEDVPLRERLSEPVSIDGGSWHVWGCHTRLICHGCGREFLPLEPRLFSHNSPLGACPACQGTGESADGKSPCPECNGQRLRPEALAVRVAGRNLPDLCSHTAAETLAICERIPETIAVEDRVIAHKIVPRLLSQLRSLQQVGLGYLTLDRPATTLSAGESRRVSLTAALGSQLVNTLFVLDEPTAGLHPSDTERLIESLHELRDLGNTLVVVEHDQRVLREADWIVELGPGAGTQGGQVVFTGTAQQIAAAPQSLTGAEISRLETAAQTQKENSTSARRREVTGELRLTNVRHRNLQGIDLHLPLGVLCAVSGVSGSGKSSLIIETLYPALAAALGKTPSPTITGAFAELTGHADLAEVVLVDPLPPARSSRSNLLTLLGTFQHVRAQFAQTAEAKVLNFSQKDFSFNHREGGRCGTCQGLGTLAIDLQFLPDVSMTCPDCGGTRYRPEILQVKYRGLNIAEVLNQTVKEAFAFFRGIGRVQRRLQSVRDVGLDYLPLGQPLDSLSGGELQRLKLAAASATRTQGHTLYILDEPTIGLHPADVRKVLTSWNHLLDAGHSIVVIEHNLDVLRSADYVIDLGPGAGAAGGRIVAKGTPSEVAAVKESVTGRYL